MWKSYRSKEDQTQYISQSVFVTNFPDHVTARDLLKVCNDYRIVVDAFIPYKKSKACFYVSIFNSSKTNNVMSDQVLPSLLLDDSCISDRDFSLSLMGKVKDITTMPNLYVILEKEGFQNLSLTYLGGLWVLIKNVSISVKEKLLNHTGVVVEMEAIDPFISNDSYESESSDDEEDAKDDGSQSGDKVTPKNNVEMVSESSCMHNNDLLYDNNQNNIMPDKDKFLSNDPLNLYDILNKRKDSGDDLKYPHGFTPSGINVEEVNKKVKGATSNEEAKIESIELVTIKTLWDNSSFDYALSSSLGSSGGVFCDWEPTLFAKDNVTSSDNFLHVMGTWVPSSSKLLIISVYKDLTENRVLWDCVIIGNFNDVRTEQDRHGSVFNVQGANAFNNFISLESLIDLPLNGYAYTWAYKTANKMSKLDRFLVFKGLLASFLQKNTLIEYMILFGVDNRPPMLDKDLHDSWKSIMELYMQNREHRRMMLESAEHSPHIWPTIEENRVIKTKKYAKLSAAEKIQANCDMKETNIIL
nr:RNA-directed DNA polymerase, eukaryota [Tanacetum cinerariifolium]